MSDVLVIVPVLAAAQASERLIRPLHGRSSLHRTLASAREDLEHATVVVTTDDKAVADHARAFSGDVVVHDRTVVPYTEALVAVLDGYPEAEVVVVLEPTHPFRPRGLASRTAVNLKQREHLDSVVCARQFRANLWRLETDGQISALTELGDRRDVTYFQEMIGLALATRPRILRAGRRLGDMVGFEVVDQFWALADIRDDVSLAVADLFADHLNDLRESIA
jgi:hypothetical protein